MFEALPADMHNMNFTYRMTLPDSPAIAAALGFGRSASAVILLAMLPLVNCWGSPPEKRARPPKPQPAANVLYVDQSDPTACDCNSGQKGSPLKTLSKAADIALNNAGNGISTRVLIGAGVYREILNLTGSARRAPMSFEAVQPGTVIVSGSDPWPASEWRREANGIFSHSWQYRWGLAPYQDGWAGSIVLSDHVRRREMLFANGSPLQQVLSMKDLVVNAFYVEEQTGVVYVNFGQQVSTLPSIEVSSRAVLANIMGQKNVTLKGLIFERSNAFIAGGAAVFVQQSSGIQIEDCIARDNNATGIRFHQSQQITITGSTARDNGVTGMVGWQSSDILIDRTDTSSNGWRGYRGGFYEWEDGGAKFIACKRTTLRNHRASDNLSFGIWFDWDNEDVRIETSTIIHNLRDGVYIEATPGPFAIVGSTIAGNQRGGVLLANSEQGNISDNLIYNNSTAQIVIAGHAGGRLVDISSTGSSSLLFTGKLNISNNSVALFAGQNAYNLLLPAADCAIALNTSTFQNNRYYSAQTMPFAYIADQPRTFSEWQATAVGEPASVMYPLQNWKPPQLF